MSVVRRLVRPIIRPVVARIDARVDARVAAAIDRYDREVVEPTRVQPPAPAHEIFLPRLPDERSAATTRS